MKSHVLLTGGLGYWLDTCVRLLELGYAVTILDNLSNSSPEVVDKIVAITGIRPYFLHGDLLDLDLLEDIFRDHQVEAVIHFAGFKAVGESVALPLRYYRNNLVSTLNLLDRMEAHQVQTLIFSSRQRFTASQVICRSRKTPPVRHRPLMAEASCSSKTSCKTPTRLTRSGALPGCATSIPWVRIRAA